MVFDCRRSDSDFIPPEVLVVRAQEHLLKEVRISDLQAQNRELRREKHSMMQRSHICLLVLFDSRPYPSLTVIDVDCL